MPIAGLPGASEPSFMTRDRALVSFDTLVTHTVEEMLEQGHELSTEVTKATIQLARQLVCATRNLDRVGLAELVTRELRRFRIVLMRPLVEAILATYAGIVARMDIAEVY